MKFVQNIGETLACLQEQVKDLQDLADNTLAPFKNYKKYPSLRDYKWSKFYQGAIQHGLNLSDPYFFCRHGAYNSITKEQLDEGLAHFGDTYRRWLYDSSRIRQENKEIEEHNAAQLAKIKKLMAVLGVVETKSFKPNYLKDIDKVMPSHDYLELTKRIEAKLKSVEAWGKEALMKAEKKRQEQAQMAKEEELVQGLAFLRAKYTPSQPKADIGEVLEAILEKDK